jgi:hypothetical protein
MKPLLPMGVLSLPGKLFSLVVSVLPFAQRALLFGSSLFHFFNGCPIVFWCLDFLPTVSFDFLEGI